MKIWDVRRHPIMNYKKLPKKVLSNSPNSKRNKTIPTVTKTILLFQKNARSAFGDEVPSPRKRKIATPLGAAIFGAVTRTRTGDLILTKDALYLLSYNSISDSSDIIAEKTNSVNYFFQNFCIFCKTSSFVPKMCYNSRERT